MTDDTIETLRARLAEAERERDDFAEQVKLLQKDALCSMLRMTWRMHDSALAENEKLREGVTAICTQARNRPVGWRSAQAQAEVVSLATDVLAALTPSTPLPEQEPSP